MQVIYARSATPGGLLIRCAQGSGQWSHGGVVMPDDTVVNARWGKGVVREDFDRFIERYAHFDQVEIVTPEDDLAYQMAERMARENWGYGYGEFLNFLTNKLGHLEQPDRVHCIELIELCAMAGGRVGKQYRWRDHVQPHVITPQQSYITR